MVRKGANKTSFLWVYQFNLLALLGLLIKDKNDVFAGIELEPTIVDLAPKKKP